MTVLYTGQKITNELNDFIKTDVVTFLPKLQILKLLDLIRIFSVCVSSRRENQSISLWKEGAGMDYKN